MAGKPNVLWITLDSVRFDHTSLAGYRHDTTPNLSHLAEDGTSFSNCISAGIWTLPSTTSILTGTFPSHHGVGLGNERLPDSLATVPELLSDVGYRTACVSRNTHLSEATGLDRGFDRFEWLAASTFLDAASPATLLKYLCNIRRHSAGFQRDTAKHATPFLVNDIARRWLGEFAGEDDPFFVYLHYNEPHRPYYPPLPYLDRYTDDLSMSTEEAAAFAMDVHYDIDEIVANGCQISDEGWAALKAMYDAEIAYTDEMVGRLIKHAQSVVDDLVVVVTADHGELFGEQGMMAHKVSLHDAVTNVPLVVSGLSNVDSGQVVQHADVMRTLVERVDGDASQLRGVNLASGRREFAVSQRGEVDFDEFLAHNPEFDTERYPGSATTALRTTEYKFVESDDARTLYRLPDENCDVSDDNPDLTEQFTSRLSTWMEENGHPVESGGEAEFTDAMKRQLRDLGYIE